MAYTPSVNPQPPAKGKNNPKVIYAVLIGALALTMGYLIYDKSETKTVIEQKEVLVKTVSTAKDSIKAEFDKVSIRLDSLAGTNTKLQGDLAEKNNALLQQKASIGAILKKDNVSASELKNAREMVKDLNGKIDGYVEEINQLKAQNLALDSANKQLLTEKTTLTGVKKSLEDSISTTEAQKKALAEQVDVASTLKASAINITAMEVKSGGKEVEVTKAKNVNLFKISCTIDENRVAQSGKKILYVCVFNPNGTPVASEGNFTMRDGSEKAYTSKQEIDYEQGKVTPVTFSWKPGSKFTPGDYKIEIYNNGFLIGKGQKALRKGGLF